MFGLWVGPSLTSDRGWKNVSIICRCPTQNEKKGHELNRHKSSILNELDARKLLSDFFAVARINSILAATWVHPIADMTLSMTLRKSVLLIPYRNTYFEYPGPKSSGNLKLTSIYTTITMAYFIVVCNSLGDWNCNLSILKEAYDMIRCTQAYISSLCITCLSSDGYVQGMQGWNAVYGLYGPKWDTWYFQNRIPLAPKHVAITP